MKAERPSEPLAARATPGRKPGVVLEACPEDPETEGLRALARIIAEVVMRNPKQNRSRETIPKKAPEPRMRKAG